MRLGDIGIERWMTDPPDEAFEATWRDTLKLLEEEGPSAGFVLITARDNGLDHYNSRFAISPGRDRIQVGVLVQLLYKWLSLEADLSEEE